MKFGSSSNNSLYSCSDNSPLVYLSASTLFLSLINFLDGLGVDVSSLRALIELPTTIEEYIEKTEQRIEDRYGRMMAKGEAAYKELRSEISATDYAQYLQKIESEYGSLAAYWTALKKNK